MRARLPGVQILTTAPPGSNLDRLQKLAAEKRGLLTHDEVVAALRRMSRTHDGDWP